MKNGNVLFMHYKVFEEKTMKIYKKIALSEEGEGKVLTNFEWSSLYRLSRWDVVCKMLLPLKFNFLIYKNNLNFPPNFSTRM